MGIRKMSSLEALKAANQFINKIKEGQKRKRILPNEGKPFDEGKALELCKICKKKAYGFQK
jgi:hypothetical protein